MTKTAKERIEEEHNFPKYDLDTDFWRNRWVESSAESLQQQLKLIKLEKKLATAVEALENIGDAEYQFAEGYNYDSDSVIINGEECSPDELQKLAKQALAEIGGEDE